MTPTPTTLELRADALRLVLRPDLGASIAGLWRGELPVLVSTDDPLALVDGELAGCGALRALPDADYANACEMKRLYVRPAFRRYGLGRILAQALIDQARQAGYSSMLLDTLDDMEAARGLYGSLGFDEIPPYYYNPIPGAHYLKVDLDH